MASYIAKTDILINVYREVGISEKIGLDSIYSTKIHPGTGNKITGFIWDKRTWPSDVEAIQEHYINMLYDNNFSFLPKTDWQSGIGDGNDLKLLAVEEHYRDSRRQWLPKVSTGYFYLQDQEHYLYGEGENSELFSGIVDSGNFEYIRLAFNPKETIPVRVLNYKWDKYGYSYQINREFRKKYDFTPIISSGEELSIRDSNDDLIHSNINVSEPEFILRYDQEESPPLIILNGNWVETNNQDVLVSGVNDPLELLGTSDGSQNQVFHTYLSPINPSGEVKIYTYGSTEYPVEWTINSGINAVLTSGDNFECLFDRDLGTIQFGTYSSLEGEGDGHIPSYGHKVAIKYTATHTIQYECENTPDYRIGNKADMNPIYGASSMGFTHVRNGEIYPSSLVLSADAAAISANIYGPIAIGRAYAKLICEVKDNKGGLVEGQNIRFEIMSPTVGSFGGDQTKIESISNYNGQAFAFYSPPTNITEMGDASNTITYSGLNTKVHFDNLPAVDENSNIYTFLVKKYDPFAWPVNELDTYYENFFEEAEISVDENGDFIGNLSKEKTFEGVYRNANELPLPITVAADNLKSGEKKALLFYDSSAVNPSTGILGAYNLMSPDSISTTNSGVDLTYSGILNLGTDYKSFFVATNSQAYIRASVYNSALKRRIYSNIISVKIEIPESSTGVYTTEALESLPDGLLTRSMNDTEFEAYRDSLIVSGEFSDTDLESEYLAEAERKDQPTFELETRSEWFDRTRRGDNILLGLKDVSTLLTGSGKIPLGFRLRSSGITMASALDGVVFFDANDPLNSGIFES